MSRAERDGRQWIAAALARYERPLVRYAHRLLGDLELARDVAQDCFLRLCRERPEEIDGHLRAWLYRVCRNRATDHLRRRRRMDRLEKEDALPTTAATDGAAHAEQADEHRRLARCVAALPDRQQELLRLKFQDGLSYREIAAVTRLTVSNVGYLLHTAIRTLRDRLETEGNQA